MLADPERGPNVLELFGDPHRFAETTAVKGLAGENLAVREALLKKLDLIRAELAGPDPAPLERLLVERAAYCWFAVWEYEFVYAVSEGLSVKQAAFHQARIDSAHRRFLSSLKTLATVRRLAVPAVQLNLGGQQINVAG